MALSPDIILETDRCKLRQIKKEDIPFIFSATRYQGFNDGLLWDAPESEDELIEGYYERVIKTWNEGKSYAFTICLKEENKQLGTISIRKNSEEVWTTGFWLHPQSQGKGYMTESVKVILKFGFEVLDTEKIQAYHAVWNEKSEKVLKNVGMKFIEYIPQGFMKNGKWVEQNKLGITKEEWNKLKNQKTTTKKSLLFGNNQNH
ncbi:GNAT family N-acetyltransferase [Pleurocapsa sp. PCC 7319]|uniref:GNAT family N-acetyltransferase n=1 Tax=Pleurocapsa sp. PCC 7319 TaxID=118161 RepID=UPI000345BC0A|nr:GNAT family protein [Pleurocapsa sp. PCC 7319]